MSDFALCRTCPEVTTGRIDSGKGWLLDASSNHHNCDVKPMTSPADLPAPIRDAIVRLGAGVPINDNHIVMLKLGIALEDQWAPHPSTAPVAAPTSPTSPAPARASDAFTKSQPASTPTLATAADDDDQLTLFGGVA